VCTEAAFEPFEFVKDGKIIGYGSDLLALVVEDLGTELTQFDLPFQGILPALLAKKCDFVATSYSSTPERVAKYAFTVPIAEATMYIMKRAGDDSIKEPNDLSERIVGTQLAGAGSFVMEDFNKRMKNEGKPLADVRLYTAYPEAYTALVTGQVEAVIQILPSIQYAMAKQPDVFALGGAIGPKTWLHWVTRCQDQALRGYLNEQFLKFRDNGKMYEAQKKWLGFKTEIPSSEYLPDGAC